MKVVIETKDEYKNMLQEIATAIKAKITFEEKEVDFWDELPEHVKAGILESQEQFKQGKFSTHEEVMAKYKTKYNL
jgi:predicted transcriptional regulator